jgi:DNA-binding winged helix-turn-helix (wHTH) protein/TolB-like protein
MELVCAPDDPDATSRQPAVFRFGDFALDTGRYQLERRGRRVRLEGQPLDLLILLVERNGALVTHEEIAARLWGQDAFVEVATGIHSAIRKIRLALRDDAETPRFIESVARRGYRFIAPVEVHSPPTESTTAPATPSLPPAAGTPPPASEPPPEELSTSPAARVPRTVWLAVLLVCLGTAIAWSRWRSPPPSPVRLALLAFENLSGEPALDYVARGIAEETIAALVQVAPGHLSVVGRTPGRLTSTVDDPRALDVARELDAHYLLEGSVRADEQRLRLTVRLIRARGMLQVWSASLDRQRSALLGVERELANALAEQIRLQLSPQSNAQLAARQTRFPEAYDLYLRGRYLTSQATPASVLQAIESFRAAIAVDPDYGLAWAGIALAYSGLPINSDFPPLETWEQAHLAASRAVALRPDLAETQVSLARVAFFDRNWVAAEPALRQAIAIDGDSAEARILLGHLLSQTARHAEALEEAARARSLDPFSAMVQAISAQIAFQARRNQDAVAHARQALLLLPEFWIAHMQEAQALEQLGQLEPALEAAARAERLSQGNSKPISLNGFLLARAGRETAARAVLARLEQLATTRFVPPYAMALVHAGLGDPDAALASLERAERARDVHLVFLPVDPKWDPLRDDPRFEALLERAGLRPRSDTP